MGFSKFFKIWLVDKECGEAYYTSQNCGRIDKLTQKSYRSSLRVHPLAAGEVSLSETEA